MNNFTMAEAIVRMQRVCTQLVELSKDSDIVGTEELNETAPIEIVQFIYDLESLHVEATQKESPATEKLGEYLDKLREEEFEREALRVELGEVPPPTMAEVRGEG